jgi:hypothetical protein
MKTFSQFARMAWHYPAGDHGALKSRDPTVDFAHDARAISGSGRTFDGRA